MKISVFGLGYVGCVTAACFADLGNEVIGYDSNSKKINMLKKAQTYIKEEGLERLLNKTVLQTQKLKLTDSADYALDNSDLNFICVGTPISLGGDLDTKYLKNVCNTLADSIKKKENSGKKHRIVIRSSVVPGTVDNLKKIFQDKGLVYGKDFLMATNPELLREGSAIRDFMRPPHIIVGADEEKTADMVGSVYKGVNAKIIKSSIKTAELVKLVDNSWHALKLDFVNEISSICKKTGINTNELLDIFLSDTDLNISTYYFRPSIGFGGSCLPKDLTALIKKADDLKVDCALLKSILPSNIAQINRAFSLVKEEANKIKTNKVGVYGVSFKPGTDDIRGSPVVYLIDKLRANGYDVKIYDPIIKKEQIENIRLSYRKTINDPLMNKLLQIDNFKDILPIIENKLCSLDETLKSDLIIANVKMPLEDILKLEENQTIVDVQGVTPPEYFNQGKANYVALWK